MAKNDKKGVKVASANQLGYWALLLGVIVAVLTAFISLKYSAAILLVLGAVGGYVLVSDRDAHQFIIYALGLWLGVRTLSALWEISPMFNFFVSAIENIGALFYAAVLVVAIRALARTVGFIK